MARNHMSEAEWTVFAASKNLDPDTGGEIKAPTESVGMNDYDFRLLMGQFAKLNNAIERMQIFMVIGFAALAILHFIH
jgi:hypothetical protein